MSNELAWCGIYRNQTLLTDDGRMLRVKFTGEAWKGLINDKSITGRGVSFATPAEARTVVCEVAGIPPVTKTRFR